MFLDQMQSSVYIPNHKSLYGGSSIGGTSVKHVSQYNASEYGNHLSTDMGTPQPNIPISHNHHMSGGPVRAQHELFGNP